VSARSGRTDADVRSEIKDVFVAWALSIIGRGE
jgi:hypothetical protein